MAEVKIVTPSNEKYASYKTILNNGKKNSKDDYVCFVLFCTYHKETEITLGSLEINLIKYKCRNKIFRIANLCNLSINDDVKVFNIHEPLIQAAVGACLKSKLDFITSQSREVAENPVPDAEFLPLKRSDKKSYNYLHNKKPVYFLDLNKTSGSVSVVRGYFNSIKKRSPVKSFFDEIKETTYLSDLSESSMPKAEPFNNDIVNNDDDLPF